MPEIEKYQDVVLLSLRLPRIIMVLLIGSSLGISGAVSQGIFRNPLVSPFILGISSGASFGAGVAMIFFSGLPFMVDLGAAIGGFGAVLAAFLIARSPGGFTPRLSLVLSGVIVSSFFTSMVGILKYLADSESQLPALTFWMMGSFASIDWASLDPVVYIIPLCMLPMVIFSWYLNILSLGDREAMLLGMNVERWKMFSSLWWLSRLAQASPAAASSAGSAWSYRISRGRSAVRITEMSCRCRRFSGRSFC